MFQEKFWEALRVIAKDTSGLLLTYSNTI